MLLIQCSTEKCEQRNLHLFKGGVLESGWSTYRNPDGTDAYVCPYCAYDHELKPLEVAEVPARA